MGTNLTSRRAMSRAAVISALIGFGLTVAPAHTAAADDPVLEGMYKLYFGEGTANGVPSSVQRMTYWYDFRTDCSGGCTAVGEQENTDDRSGPHPGFDSVVSLQFLDGHWFRSGQHDTTCRDGSVVRFTWSWTLNPQPDGSLTGTRTNDPSGRCPEFETFFVTQTIVATRDG